jgi:alkyldihydroxyacetonephosphate synthase
LTAPAITNALADRIAGRCLMLLGFEGQSEVVALSARLARELALERGQATELGAEPAELWWRNRHAVSFKQSEVFGMGAFSDTMEVATTWDRIEELYATVRAALAPHAVVLAHFSHAYHSGCSIYFSVAVRCRDQQEALERYRELWRAGLDAVVRCGAAVSHHHGVGLLKAEAFKRSLGPLHGTLVQLKQSLDPANILNPGKLGLP